MAFEWVAGLFQSDQTRGLSGDSASAVALDDANPYYNYRLRRHLAEGDIIQDPSLLWYTSPYVKQRTGLGTHVGAEVGEGIANYTDVLLILSHEDYARSRKVSGESWDTVASRSLAQEFDNFCRREEFSRLHVHRPLGFRVLCDGGDDMAGQSLGLQRGEFITGLLPNLYTGPVRGSSPVIGIHVNLPGVWDGYQEVGRLHNDQILFTLGAHWLDNFSHPSLLEAALYRLQQYPDGSFVHIINPDLQDRYQVTSTDQNGASVLTLATRDGQPLAYIVLAVIDPPVAEPPEDGAGDKKPGIAMPALKPTPKPKSQKSDAIPSVAPPMLIDDVLQPIARETTTLGGKTIIPDAPSERIFTLQERGALLQKIHFSAFMLGYDVYLGTRGELGTVVESVAATFQVRRRMVSLVAHVSGVTIDGQDLTPGVEEPLEKDVVIEYNGQTLDYRNLRGMRIESWPYVGEIRRPASSTYMIWGEEYKIGRSRECRVVLPDEPRNDNIHWKAKVADGATIRARTGEIPKSRFYTDSIMVASEHATIDLDRDEPRVVCTARNCHIFVRRGDETTPLFPATSNREPQSLDIAPGDEVLIGNCLFQVGFTDGEAVAPAPAPKVEFSPDSLVNAIDAPHFGGLETPEPPDDPAVQDEPEEDEAKRKRRERHRDASLASQAPSAFGLGEEGDEPAPIPLQTGEADSILGDAATVEKAEADFEGDDESEEDEPTVLAKSPALFGGGWDDDDEDPEESEQTTVEEPEEVPEEVPEEAPEQVPEEVPEEAPEAPPPPHDEFEDAGWDEEDWGSDSSNIPPEADAEPEPDAEAEPDADPEPDAEPDAEPEPEPDAEPEPEADPADETPASSGRTVHYVDDAQAQFELGRPLHLVMIGWMVNGEVVCGNHSEAEMILPENRVVPSQTFEPVDYFRLKIRGRKGKLEILAPTELLIDEDDPAETVYTSPESNIIDVIRRDDAGEEDFAIRLQIVQDRKLPDPRARFVSIDFEDPLAAALITKGLPKGKPRTLDLGKVTATFKYDGSKVILSDYLDTYQTETGYHPFFVCKGSSRFKTAPEDGSDIELEGGDRIVVGISVYALLEE